MSEAGSIISEIRMLLAELDGLAQNEDHIIAVLRAENEAMRTELNYLRTENITLRSNQ